jgi:hypothetical protein
MKDENKTKKQLIDELVGLRHQITNLGSQRPSASVRGCSSGSA